MDEYTTLLVEPSINSIRYYLCVEPLTSTLGPKLKLISILFGGMFSIRLSISFLANFAEFSQVKSFLINFDSISDYSLWWS